MLARLGEKSGNVIHLIFRVMVGLLFFEHGAQKLFGWFTDRPHVHYLGLMGLAGAIEFFGGLSMAIGLFTRFAALVAAVEMLVALRLSHLPHGWIPIETGGELPLLYFAAFLVLVWKGGGRWSVDERVRLK